MNKLEHRVIHSEGGQAIQTFDYRKTITEAKGQQPV